MVEEEITKETIPQKVPKLKDIKLHIETTHHVSRASSPSLCILRMWGPGQDRSACFLCCCHRCPSTQRCLELEHLASPCQPAERHLRQPLWGRRTALQQHGGEAAAVSVKVKSLGWLMDPLWGGSWVSDPISRQIHRLKGGDLALGRGMNVKCKCGKIHHES